MNDLVTLEQTLKPLAPQFEQALAGRMPVERLMRTVLISLDRTPTLMDCSRQSILNAAMSAAVLGLEVDGVTGQAFLIPFKAKAQLVIGYRGMNTLGARSGYSITAGVVREGDDFEFKLGTSSFINHRPKLGNKDRIIAAWAAAEAVGFTPIIGVLSIDEILAIKEKSPGAKKSDSPWNDTAIGFPAMAEKSVRRRLARSMPLNARTRDYHLAARMDEAFEEQGRDAHLTPDSALVIEGARSPIAETQRNETPTAEALMAPKKDDPLAPVRAEGHVAANEGMHGLKIWFEDLPGPVRNKIGEYLDTVLKPIAREVDRLNAAKPSAPAIIEGRAEVQMELGASAGDVETELAQKRRAIDMAEVRGDVAAIVRGVTTYLKEQQRTDLLAEFMSYGEKRAKRLKE